LSDTIKSEADWVRPVMFFYLLHNKSDKKIFFISNTPNNQDEYENLYFVNKESLEKMRPQNFNEKIDMIMLNLGTRIRFWGDGYAFFISGQQEVVRLQTISSGLILICDAIMRDDNRDSNSMTQIRGTIKFLQDYGYLEHKGGTSHEYTFTVNGWKRLGELQSRSSERPQAFIAMWFSSETDRARESIKKAVYDAGYIPVIIDEKEHNNQIVPEILYEIQRSKFLIADLTGHRNGVYYEAGYAQGLGKEIILTCGEKAFNERHFDVSQISTIKWQDENDLYERLLKRIEATIGKRTKQ
jgi:hypothetical protein